MNPNPLRNLSISEFFSCFFDFLPLNLLLVQSHQVEIIIRNRLIQGQNNMSDEVGVQHRSRDHDHTIAIKMALKYFVTFL